MQAASRSYRMGRLRIVIARRARPTSSDDVVDKLASEERPVVIE
jgi:hypothetical protein